MDNEAQTTKQPSRSLRLRFSYDGSDFRLVSTKSIYMLSLPSDPVQTKNKLSGFWYELRDDQGHTLYRRVIQNPIKYFVEVRTNNPKRPLEWKKVNEPRGTFALLAPDLEEARTIELFSSPVESEDVLKPAGEYARFMLKQGRDKDEEK